MAGPKSALRILLVGDFSGHPTGAVSRVDRDNFAAVLRELAPRVELGGIDLNFAELADFEPASIYRQSELFAPLRVAGGRPLYCEPAEGEAEIPLQPSAEQLELLTSPGGLLDAVVEKGAAPAEEFRSMLKRIVAPYSLPGDDPEMRRAAAERSQRVSLLLSHILHAERFQALEAAWRGLHLLVHGLDTDRLISLYLLDVSKEGLSGGMRGAGEDWDLLVGNFTFDRAIPSDVQQLEEISLLAQTWDAPFIAEYLPSRQENAKAETAWQALRRSPAARYIALALPRFLLRLPYGKEGTPVEELDFEEMPPDPVHSYYLWGNPAVACALALGGLFEGQDSTARPRLAGMLVPATELLLSDHDCENLLREGVLPLAAVKGSDEIAFPRLQSIAIPGAPLAGFQSESW